MGYFNEISTLQYMGSKSRILNAVCEPIERNISIDTVVDLFAGTGTIGYALKPYYSIISNDLEYYAYILNEGILNGCCFSEVNESKFTNTVSVILNQIRARCQTALNREQFFFDRDDSEYLEYQAFCERTPSIVQKEQCDPYLQDVLNLINDVNPGADFQNTKLPILFITYYSNTYFGINQCCEIDAIRGAISSVRDCRIQNVLLTILMTVKRHAHKEVFWDVGNQLRIKPIPFVSASAR